jgi:hypothetical protein
LDGEGGDTGLDLSSPARIERFDQNATAFDERAALLDEELQAGLINTQAQAVVQGQIARALGELSPRARGEVVCTRSVCEVHFIAHDSVGSLIADLGPFLRKHPAGATGNPGSEHDPETAFRVLFQSDEAPR